MGFVDDRSRRRLPMVKIDKDFIFEGSDGKKSESICSTGATNVSRSRDHDCS